MKGPHRSSLLPLLCRGRGSRPYFRRVLSIKSHLLVRLTGLLVRLTGLLVRLTGESGQANDGIWSGKRRSLVRLTTVGYSRSVAGAFFVQITVRRIAPLVRLTMVGHRRRGKDPIFRQPEFATLHYWSD